MQEGTVNTGASPDLESLPLVYTHLRIEQKRKSGRTVIIGIDDSEFSEYAFDFYVSKVWVKEDKIVLVHVLEYSSLMQSPALLSDPVVVAELIRVEEEKVKRLVEKYSTKMKELKLGGKVKQMAGKCGEAIVAAAKEEGAGLVVMGTRGMGKVRRTFIGSVSDYVLHHAHRPVMICRRPKPKTDQN